MGKLPTRTYTEITPEYFRNKLKLKSFQEKINFSKKHPEAIKLLAEKGVSLDKIREHSAKIIGAGALTSALLLNSPTMTAAPANVTQTSTQVVKRVETPQQNVIESLKQVLPQGKTRPLTQAEEKKIEQIFKSEIGVPAKATLEGEHLNTTYGLIGAEQHLYRYPGDTLAQHGSGIMLAEGIAPGKGAWGYFAPSRSKLSPDLEEKEKWYAVVQTLYLPDWKKRLPYLREWYKYRKVLIVNTQNGNAVVADIADSGPAAYTGKHFGGSPEVMYYLGGSRYKKGAVVLFFVDDPNNQVPLGPVDYNNINLAGVTLKEG